MRTDHMRSALLFVVALLASISGVFAQTGSSKTPTVLNAEVNSFWPDQTSGEITPFNARQTLLDIIASYPSLTAASAFTVLCNPTAVSGVVQACTALQTLSAISAGIPANILNAQTANYSIAATDCNKTVQAGSGSSGLFTVTLPSVSGFATNCIVTIVNGDTARGKALSGFPTGVPGILYPRQSLAVAIVNGAWATLRLPGRYRPSSTLTLFVDGSLGSDSNDGLAAGSGGAFLTFGAATTALFNNIDKAGQSIVLQLASGQSWSNLSFVGTAVGNGAVILDGGSGTISGTGGVNALAVQNGIGGNVINATFLIQNVTFTCTGGGNALDVVSGYVTLNTGVTFGSCAGGAHIEADGPARIFVLGNYTISGGAGYHWLAAANGLIDFNVNVTVTISGTPAFSQQFANAQMNATIFSIVTFSGSATGTRWSAALNGVVNSGTGTPNSYFPGNANGSAATGGQGN